MLCILHAAHFVRASESRAREENPAVAFLEAEISLGQENVWLLSSLTSRLPRKRRPCSTLARHRESGEARGRGEGCI